MNNAYCEHDITLASFAQIDREVGAHNFSDDEYAVVRRIIHTTADFEFKQLVNFSHQPFRAATTAFLQQLPIITDVSMVAEGIRTVTSKTWRSPISVAVKQINSVPLGQTRSALGMQQCANKYPDAIFVIGNAPTALLTLCEGIRSGRYHPSLVVGAPVGFINVIESKQALIDLAIPSIVVTGRKGGSAVAAAIVNALMIGAWNGGSMDAIDKLSGNRLSDEERPDRSLTISS
ncbi:MAG: precorrin-8X methylmutase [Cyanobacteria bacterium P01_D01_bin.105]